MADPEEENLQEDTQEPGEESAAPEEDFPPPEFDVGLPFGTSGNFGESAALAAKAVPFTNKYEKGQFDLASEAEPFTNNAFQGLDDPGFNPPPGYYNPNPGGKPDIATLMAAAEWKKNTGGDTADFLAARGFVSSMGEAIRREDPRTQRLDAAREVFDAGPAETAQERFVRNKKLIREQYDNGEISQNQLLAANGSARESYLGEEKEERTYRRQLTMAGITGQRQEHMEKIRQHGKMQAAQEAFLRNQQAKEYDRNQRAQVAAEKDLREHAPVHLRVQLDDIEGRIAQVKNAQAPPQAKVAALRDLAAQEEEIKQQILARQPKSAKEFLNGTDVSPPEVATRVENGIVTTMWRDPDTGKMMHEMRPEKTERVPITMKDQADLYLKLKKDLTTFDKATGITKHPDREEVLSAMREMNEALSDLGVGKSKPSGKEFGPPSSLAGPPAPAPAPVARAPEAEAKIATRKQEAAALSDEERKFQYQASEVPIVKALARTMKPAEIRKRILSMRASYGRG